MLSKCSNPSCSATFHTLEDGRLFRLGPDPNVRPGRFKKVQYYWLCAECASTMTLRLGDDEDVIAVVLPLPLQNVPEIVAVALADRKKGLQLQQINSQLPIHTDNRIRSRFTLRDEVA